MDGLEELKKFTEADPEMPVIMLAALSSVTATVETMKHGAYHFAKKPLNVQGGGHVSASGMAGTRRPLAEPACGHPFATRVKPEVLDGVPVQVGHELVQVIGHEHQAQIVR